ncbi:inositol monophosphatase [Salipiger sp. P9]|uniref:inositol monophosphatase family protein n=1 Tax=Salipiger pentaromativorans TaxID=2943193 RepID=UPI002157EC42|nr:inositol monophosphatase [Salipiger pentaromativorans]MCR8548823.1 inositol monophosphatase [Salipiger pentaromativorans]
MTDSLPMPISTLTQAQRTSIMNLVRRAARTEIMPRFRSLDASDISQKTSRQDLVTEADRAAEAMIARGLVGLFPNALIVGEENVSENPEVLDKIAEAELAFTIDPVDGTWNYAHGLATFGVILSALRFGNPVFGLLYDPVMDDFVIGETNGPAEMIVPKRRVRRPLSVSAGGQVEELQGYLPLYMLPEDKQSAMAALMPRFERVLTLRCSAHEMRMLAQGHVDFVLSVRLTPWDHAAGALLCQCAGGYAAMLDGSEYNATKREGYLLCASDKATWERLRDALSFLTDAPEAAEEPAEEETADA